MKNTIVGLVGVMTLSSCQLLAVASGVSETTTGGSETLAAPSSEHVFYDAESGTVLIDARLIETRSATKQQLPGTEPIPGTVELLGQSGDIRAARWQETMNGVVDECSGWFHEAGAAWDCGDAPTEIVAPVVEYLVTCRQDRSSDVRLFTLDERVMALRIDRFDGSSIVGVDPEGRGLIGVSATGGILQALAQTTDGQVFEILSVEAAVCPPPD